MRRFTAVVVSRAFRKSLTAIFEMLRGCRATPPMHQVTPKEKHCRTHLATPLSPCRAEACLQKRIALHRGVAATLTPIALHCATQFSAMHIALQASLVLGGPKAFPPTYIKTILSAKSQGLAHVCPISKRGCFESSKIARFTSWVAKVMKGRPTPNNTHPNKNTVCANNFGTICAKSPPFFPSKQAENGRKSFAQTVCANCFYLGGCFVGWVAFPSKITSHRRLASRDLSNLDSAPWILGGESSALLEDP